MKDVYGVVPVEGDQIVYATRQSSNMSLYKAKVLEVQDSRMRIEVTDCSWWRGGKLEPVIRETWLHASNFVVVRL